MSKNRVKEGLRGHSCRLPGQKRSAAWRSCVMVFRHAWIYPVLSTLCAFIAFFVCYGIGVAKGNVNAWLPFISDGGAVPPQSCIFGLFLNLSAVFVVITVYLRHRQYMTFYARCSSFTGHWRRFSIAAMFSGFLIAVGISLVANFQEGRATYFWHNIGAMLAFWSGVFYGWCQIILAYILKPRMTPLWLNHTRTGCITCATFAVTTLFVCLLAHPFVPKGTSPKPEIPENGIWLYEPGHPRYVNHIMTTFWEWILAIVFEVTVASFAWELWDFDVELKVTRKDEVRNEIFDVKTTSSKMDAAESDRK
ncbi:hypothetical protein L596_018132 [Steinernema carpocapsae]|uniref:CWH43-like N-terminal domain-containing protein n=1 Tax=Steinernema carpocapsae TaxID=34508 RepID=A0A4U5N3Q8_STECR|nr:hypothetical protein L596_018132 [Steinernema carpocapsae]